MTVPSEEKEDAVGGMGKRVGGWVEGFYYRWCFSLGLVG